MSLTQPNSTIALLNLQTEVEAQQSQVCHLELQLHLPLESSNFFWSRVGDEQVTNVHTDDQPASVAASAVNGMLVLTLYEAELAERAIKLLVPGPRCLPQPVQRPPESQHLVFFSGGDEPLRLLHIDLLRELAVEEGRLHIHVMDFLALIRRQS
jgi:hypothetical protein